MNVGMEHGCFDMTGLAEYMRGMVDAGPTRSGHRTPTVIVEAPVNGIEAAHVRYNAWQFRQILGRGVHGILLCQAENADAVRAFVESCRYPHNTIGVRSRDPLADGTDGGRDTGEGRRHRRRRPQTARHRHAGARIRKHRRFRRHLPDSAQATLPPASRRRAPRSVQPRPRAPPCPAPAPALRSPARSCPTPKSPPAVRCNR